MNPLQITVVGSGTMGNGIAHTFAQYKHKVCLIDANPAQLDKAMSTIEKNLSRQVSKGAISNEESLAVINRITTSTQIDETISHSDLIVEAVTEKKEVKAALFRELDRLTSSSTLLTSNTSSISISDIASNCQKPDRVIGMHFMNPVPVMELVEVIKGKNTSESTIEKTIEICQSLKKKPVLANDFPGFVANRILMPMINEAIIARAQGVAGTQEIDEIMKLGMAHPMGPLELADMIGLDVCLSIIQVLYDGFKSDKYKPSPLLEKLVAIGQT